MFVPCLLVDVRVRLLGSVAVHSAEEAVKYDEAAQRARRFRSGDIVDGSEQQEAATLKFRGKMVEMLGGVLVPEVRYDHLVAIQLGSQVAIVRLPGSW